MYASGYYSIEGIKLERAINVNERNTTKKCGICSKLTIKTLRGHQWRHFGIFIVKFEHIQRLFLVFLLLNK